MIIATRLIRLAEIGVGAAACLVLAHTSAAETSTSRPDIAKIERFELTDARLHDTTHQISSTNKVASKILIEWLSLNAPPPFDPKWQGSYRPILTVRFWVRDRSEAVQISITHEWKDMQGKVWTLDDAKVSSLMTSVLKACRTERR